MQPSAISCQPLTVNRQFMMIYEAHSMQSLECMAQSSFGIYLTAES